MQLAIVGAIVAPETSAQGKHILTNVAGAWTLTRDADQFICVETSEQSIGDVKARSVTRDMSTTLKPQQAGLQD